ncbi:protein disulfide-isomerase precursor [Coemansia biformis]|uniref:protein disulfide-isomerase n=1 Tax=Coemansia biformis TaxID=1286918 RepID=A0A9W8CZ64_9FUNG|nr:protein disulfide-isomerase precursor [Coemansia biformis]
MLHLTKSAAVTLAVAAAAMLRVAGADAAASSAVHALTERTFRSWTGAQRLALVEFYAPWCVYCQALEPSYEMAAAALKKDGIPLAKVDCTQNEGLCEEMDIGGFPTMKVVTAGAFTPYNGTREEAGIVAYMRKHKQPPLAEVRPARLAEVAKSGGTVAIGFFDRKSTEFAVLEEVARALRDECTFGYVADRKLAKRQGIPVPGIAIYTDHTDGFEIYSGQPTADAIRKFIRAGSLPILGELSSQTFGTYLKAEVPIGLVFYNTDEQRKELGEKLLAVAKDYRSAVSMAFVDARIYSKHATMLNLKHKWPAFAIQHVQKRMKFLLPQDREVSDAEIRRLLGSYVDGQLMPDYKSEPLPTQNDGDVLRLVSTQFNQVAFDRTKDVLIMFYAPWCIHCKRMAPVYDELGRSLKGNANVVVAKMDATANDIPSSDADLDVSGYPTVLLIRAHDNKIVSYSGTRSLESFTDFLRLHATHSIGPQDGHAGVSSAAGVPAAAAGGGPSGYVAVSSKDVGFSPKETRHVEL